MRSLISSRGPRALVVMLVATALIIGSAASVAAKPRPKPTPTPTPTPTATPPLPSPSVAIEIAPTGTLEPSRQYANVDVTVTCPVGWSWSDGWLNLLRPDRIGGGASFSATCTGTAQVHHVRAVNGNRFLLGDWTASAHVVITKSGRQERASSTRTIRLEPGPTVRIADQGQLTGSTGSGIKIAVAAACPDDATGAPSSVTVTQGGASGVATFTPTCDRQTRTVVLPITAAQGTFHTGSADASASANVTWNGGSFSGSDSRAITILESSTGDTAPPSTPPGLGANLLGSGDGETDLTWGASSDNATPTGLLVYEVFLNGRFDQAIGGGLTKAILYSDVGVLNTIEVIAVDGAGNRSAPASVTVDLRF
jgi:hypothetical protein